MNILKVKKKYQDSDFFNPEAELFVFPNSYEEHLKILTSGGLNDSFLYIFSSDRMGKIFVIDVRQSLYEDNKIILSYLKEGL